MSQVDLIEALKASNILEPHMLWLMAMAIVAMAASSFSSPKSKRTNAIFADRTVKYNLCKTAAKQQKKQEVDEVCLYCGSFKNWQLSPFYLWISVYFFNSTPSLFVPTANPGVEVIGAPGMGKTFSVIDPLLRSAIEQKFPILLYDYKGGGDGGEGGQIPVICGYAARHDYTVRIFAPGRKYSCTINPLDFIRDSSDRSMAETLAETLHENIRHNVGKSDNFFGPAGKRVLYSSFLLAKNTPHPDLAMAFAILQLPELGKRLRYAREQKNPVLNVWNYVAFSQYMSFAQAGETSEGILGGAQDIASIFIQPDFLPCIIGHTNISLDLTSKEILAFQSNESRKKVYNPLMAAIIEVIVNRNFSYQRTVPLVLSLDEYKTIKIPESIHWPNYHRSKGLVMLVGYQNEAQVSSEYGKDGLSTVQTGLKASFLFNPKNDEHAVRFSKSLGNKEIVIKNKSRSYGGGKGGSSRSVSEQSLLVPLMNPDDILGMRLGAAIYKSPRLYKGERGNIPWKIRKVRVSLADRLSARKSKQIWLKKSVKRLEQYETKRRPYIGDDLQIELDKRLEHAEEMLPLPPEENQKETLNKDLVGLDAFI